MTDNPITQDQLDEGLAAAEHAAAMQAQYDADARLATWTEAFVRLNKAAEYKTLLDQIGDFLTKEGPAVAAAQAALEDRIAKFTRAQADEVTFRDKYNAARGTGMAMRQMVIDQCAVKEVPIPQDPEPPLIVECDHLSCPGCAGCSCHTNPAHTGLNQVQEPADERPLGGVS
jgi:hypothetical protein